MKDKKIISVLSILFIALVLSLGITFAALSYQRTGENQSLVLGDIWMKYTETNQLTLEDAMPSATYDSSKYFEFKISGKNTYEKENIMYDIKLSYGEDHDTRTERIKDNLLKFTLVEIKDGVEATVVNAASYEDLSNQKIWTSVIPKSTNEEIEITYRLYMWVSLDTNIGNTSDADYDMNTWNNLVFGSVKVNVTGDFKPRLMVGQDGQYEYALLSSGKIQISRYLGEEINVVIPSEYDGYDVYSIGNMNATLDKNTRYNIFGTIGNTSVKSVTISDGIEVIEVGAFDRCTGLTAPIELPNSITKIGSYAFYNCSNMNGSLDLPDNLTTLGRLAFSGCSKLTGDLVIPNTVTTMEAGAFQNCKGFNGTLTLSNSLTTIPQNAFYGCTGFTGNLVIPDTVTTIASAAFNECSSMTGELKLPSKLVELGDSAFNHCTDFTNTTLDIPVTLKTLGTTHMFYDFATTTIEAYTINNDLNGVGEYFKAVDGVLYSSDNTTLVLYPGNKVGNTYELAEGVTNLNELAFSRNGSSYSSVPDTGLKKLVLPNSLVLTTTLPSNYLNTGNNLAVSIYIYTGINEIGVKDDNPNYKTIDGVLYSKDGTALWYVPVHKTGVVNIEDGVTTIKSGALYGGNKEYNLTIPASVTNIESTELTMLKNLGPTRVTFDPNCIYQFNASGTVVKNS